MTEENNKKNISLDDFNRLVYHLRLRTSYEIDLLMSGIAVVIGAILVENKDDLDIIPQEIVKMTADTARKYGRERIHEVSKELLINYQEELAELFGRK